MCGFAGVRSGAGHPVSPAVLEEMNRVLAHRGPDEAGCWVGPGIGLAHTRLSIIDLEGSRQPMTSHDGRWVLAFNGEIFNHRALRDRLDYPFRTQGDTEVLLAGLATHGLDFLSELRGQFAFVAHDLHTRTTHLVRDRLGILPLYYRVLDHELAFASEIKALLALGPAPDVDLDSLDAYLAARAVPSPDTLFAGIKKLPPGHRAEIDASGALAVHRWWAPPSTDPVGTWDASSATEAVAMAVQEAVRHALVADVPVGAYLSGGVDSSLIVAQMQRLRGGDPVMTFSAGFGDPRHDELPWARRVSELIGTTHHEVDVREGDFERLWPMLTWHRDAPISEPADIAVFTLARAARQHVRVVLSGEGGDELFAGYPKHRYARLVERLAVVPPGVRNGVATSVERHLGARFARHRIAIRAVGARDEAQRVQAWFAPFTEGERVALLHGLPRRELRPLPALTGVDPLDRMLRRDLEAWLPDNLLERGDRMSMAASLELRPPLLDHGLVELAFRLPSSVKQRNGHSKWVLKEVARRHLPAEVVDRRKVGFRVPLDRWFRDGLRDTAWDRLTGTDSWVGQTLDRAVVRSLLERHDKGIASEEARLWTLLSLEVWHERFFRSPDAVPAASRVGYGRTRAPLPPFAPGLNM